MQSSAATTSCTALISAAHGRTFGRTPRARRRFVDFDWAPAEPPRLAPAILATVYEDQSRTRAATRRGITTFLRLLPGSLPECEQTDVRELVRGAERAGRVRRAGSATAGVSAARRESAFEGTDVAPASPPTAVTFQRACFPVGLRQRGFTIFDWNEGRDGADFIAVDHDEEDAAEAAAPMGSVYSSGRRSGQLYSISLRRNLYFSGAVDFINVEGIEGVHRQPDRQRRVRQPEGGGRVARISSRQRISFNGGGAWRAGEGPAIDVTGQPATPTIASFTCGASRSGLGTWKTRLGSVYSQPSAPGWSSPPETSSTSRADERQIVSRSSR